MIHRRGLLAGLGALLAAPAIIRTPGLLMPVRPVVVSLDELLNADDLNKIWNDWYSQVLANLSREQHEVTERSRVEWRREMFGDYTGKS